MIRAVVVCCILLTMSGLANTQQTEHGVAPKLILQAAGGAGAPIAVPYFEHVDISVDGRLDEAVWSQVPGYDAMLVIEPEMLIRPKYRTISRFVYTSEGLYVAAFMEQPPETLISRLSSRDKYINRDSYGLTLDTSGEGLYGYWFVVNLGGSLMDGKVALVCGFGDVGSKCHTNHGILGGP